MGSFSSSLILEAGIDWVAVELNYTFKSTRVGGVMKYGEVFIIFTLNT